MPTRQKRHSAAVSQLTGAEKRARAVELRALGKTYPEIGAELGVTAVTARGYIERSMQFAAELPEATRELVKAEPAPLAATTPEAEALRLRKEGYSYQEIAIKLDQDAATVQQWVLEGLDRLAGVEARHADALRQLELMRLDDLTKVLTPRSNAGEMDATNTLIRIQERRAKLMGLDAPVKIDLEANLKALAVEFELPPEELLDIAKQVAAEMMKGK